MQLNLKPLMHIGLFATLGFLTGCQSYLVFNTETKFGLDISQSAQQEPQVTLGYERSAIVSMPVARDTNDLKDANATNDAYSVVGSFNVDYDPRLLNTNSGIHIVQLFATGFAADEETTNKALAAIFGQQVGSIYNEKSANSTPSTNHIKNL